MEGQGNASFAYVVFFFLSKGYACQIQLRACRKKSLSSQLARALPFHEPTRENSLSFHFVHNSVHLGQQDDSEAISESSYGSNLVHMDVGSADRLAQHDLHVPEQRWTTACFFTCPQLRSALIWDTEFEDVAVLVKKV
eukprot:936431-Pelagomonas_calceolata.AAC.8